MNMTSSPRAFCSASAAAPLPSALLRRVAAMKPSKSPSSARPSTASSLARRRRGADRYLGSQAAAATASKKAGSYYDGDRDGDPRRAGLRAPAAAAPTCSTASCWSARCTTKSSTSMPRPSNRMHTGRPTSGTIIYPSIGSIVAHERGAAGDGVPAYVLIGYPERHPRPRLPRLEARLRLSDRHRKPARPASSRAADITADRQARREELLAKVRERLLSPTGRRCARRAIRRRRSAKRCAWPARNSSASSSSTRSRRSLRDAYGGEFGQRCLLARRLVESGVRFIEVSHNLNFLNGTGWDTHNEGMLQQHELIHELDTALSALRDRPGTASGCSTRR